MNKRNNEFLSFNSSMLIQCALLFAGICAGLWINTYCLVLVAGFTLCVALIGKTESAYYHLLFTLPFTMIYKLSPASTSLFAYVMLAVCALLILRVRSVGKEQLLLLLLLAAYLAAGMGSNGTTVIKMLAGFVLFYIFVKEIGPDEFKNQVMAFSLGMIGSSAIGLLKGSWERLDMYYNDMNIIYIGKEQALRFTGLYLDPNYFSVSVIFAMFLCLMLLFSKKGNPLVLGTVTVALASFGFISYSKMFLLCFVLLVGIFVLWMLKTLKRIFIALCVVLLSGSFVINKVLQSTYVSVMLDRLTSHEDISTGRFDIWKDYIGYFSESPKTFLVGDGLGAPYYQDVGPHNTYIEAVFFLGIIGSLLFMLCMFSVFIYKKHTQKRSILNYGLVWIFLVMIATLGCLTVNDLLFYCMLMWMGLNIETDVKKEIDEDEPDEPIELDKLDDTDGEDEINELLDLENVYGLYDFEIEELDALYSFDDDWYDESSEEGV